MFLYSARLSPNPIRIRGDICVCGGTGKTSESAGHRPDCFCPGLPKKRPRGIFPYTGHRYDDGRQDLRLSFERQFLEVVYRIDKSVFRSGKTTGAKRAPPPFPVPDGSSLAYIDPPNDSPLSDNAYMRRSHFVEGCPWPSTASTPPSSRSLTRRMPVPSSRTCWI